GLRYDARVRKREVLGDYVAPAVGSKFNRRHRGQVGPEEVYAKRYIRQTAGLACIRVLQKIPAPLFFQPFHDFADILGAIAGDDEQGVRCFDDNEVADANDRGEFSGNRDEVSVSVNRISWRDENV